jgi:hypothetical protein
MENKQEELTMSLDDDLDQTNDEIEIQVGKDAVVFKISKTILTSMSNVCKTAFESDPNATMLRFENFEPEVFSIIKNYVEHHKSPSKIPERPAQSKIFAMCVEDKWDANLIDELWADPTKRKIFYDVIKMSNWLHIQCLLEKLCCKVGSQIMGIPENPKETQQQRLEAIIDPLCIAGVKKQK